MNVDTKGNLYVTEVTGRKARAEIRVQGPVDDRELMRGRLLLRFRASRRCENVYTDTRL